MLDPSSSEEESENETIEDENSDVLSVPSAERSLSASGDNLSVQSSRPNTSQARPSSPSPSLISEREKSEDADKNDAKSEEERKRRLQLYVFVMRCIAYPFNAKQPTDMARRQTKITKQQLQTIKDRFSAFLNGETNIVADEAFTNAVQSYYEVFVKSDRVLAMVKSGGSSANDFREVFKNNIEKRVRSLPEIDGLSKETVLSSWMTKYDAIFRGEEDPRKHPQRGTTAASELILSKEQLYDMFQNILTVKKYEHQILYNACQVSKFLSDIAIINTIFYHCLFFYQVTYLVHLTFSDKIMFFFPSKPDQVLVYILFLTLSLYIYPSCTCLLFLGDPIVE